MRYSPEPCAERSELGYAIRRGLQVGSDVLEGKELVGPAGLEPATTPL
jgi:hypothetical protein